MLSSPDMLLLLLLLLLLGALTILCSAKFSAYCALLERCASASAVSDSVGYLIKDWCFELWLQPLHH
jgi:hypothetical protein